MTPNAEAEILGAASARAPGACGELVQGLLNGSHFLVTCPVDMYSTVQVELTGGAGHVFVSDAPCDSPKARCAVELTLAHLGRHDVDAWLRICSPLPRSKGMASSTADVSAAIMATAAALQCDDITPEQIAKLALAVEPSDGLMLPGVAMFDHKRGSVAKTLGDPPPMRVVVLDFGGSVDTIAFNGINRDTALMRLEPHFQEALSLITQGIVDRDAAAIGAGATISAVANQDVLYKPQLDAVLRLAHRTGALGVNAAHSGTVMGMLFPDDMQLVDAAASCARQSLYGIKNVFVRRIVSGGVRLLSPSPPASPDKRKHIPAEASLSIPASMASDDVMDDID